MGQQTHGPLHLMLQFLVNWLQCDDCIWLQDFVYQIGNPPVSNVKTNGLYYEPGEKSYMRETIAYQVLG